MFPEVTYIRRRILNFEKINQFMNCSVSRNKADVLITETGYSLPGESLPKSVKDVEANREIAFNA